MTAIHLPDPTLIPFGYGHTRCMAPHSSCSHTSLWESSGSIKQPSIAVAQQPYLKVLSLSRMHEFSFGHIFHSTCVTIMLTSHKEVNIFWHRKVGPSTKCHMKKRSGNWALAEFTILLIFIPKSLDGPAKIQRKLECEKVFKSFVHRP